MEMGKWQWLDLILTHALDIAFFLISDISAWIWTFFRLRICITEHIISASHAKLVCLDDCTFFLARYSAILC